MPETKKVSINQYQVMKESMLGAPGTKEHLHQLITEIKVVSEPGARSFEQEVNQMLRDGWVILDARVVHRACITRRPKRCMKAPD